MKLTTLAATVIAAIGLTILAGCSIPDNDYGDEPTHTTSAIIEPTWTGPTARPIPQGPPRTAKPTKPAGPTARPIPQGPPRNGAGRPAAPRTGRR